MKKTIKTETTSTYELTAEQIMTALKLARFAKLFVRRHGEADFEFNRDTKLRATEECDD